MPGVTVSSNEINAAGGNVGVTATAFIAAATDQAPISGPGYTACRSINDYTFNFGARSTTSATAYDWLDEFFHDGGQLAYVSRNLGTTATAAALTLNDASAHPTVVVTASSGVNGNSLYVAVARGTSATFTGVTANSSTAVTGVSSFANIGVGTPVTATTGIAANTYVAAVNAAAGTLTLSANANATGSQTITPATFTLTVQDSVGDILETHGPYITTAQLYADTSSTLTAFTQSAGGSFTTYVPVASSATALTGGANATDLSAATAVSALAVLTAALGPGSVALPGYATSTAWTGLLAHAASKNRFAILDTPDNATAAAVVSNFGTIVTNAQWGMAIQGSLTIPGITPGTTRTVAGSAAVAALRAQVGATTNQNQNPSGVEWPLTYPIGFTTYYGSNGTFLASDVNSMSSAGINCFAVRQGVSCLYGFVTPVLYANDVIFWQATATCERMSLISDGTAAIEPFLFATLDGSNKTLIAAQTALQAVIATHWSNGALFGATASQAGQVNMGAPINTPTTEAAGQLNANLQVRISPYVNTINETITTVPITVPVV